MDRLPKKLQEKLQQREEYNTLRRLPYQKERVDFSSNDYLGFARSKKIFDTAHQLLEDKKIHQNGATGSRLLSGNHVLYQETELQLARFHKTQAALIFNSGYDANVGFFSSVPQRGDIIFYDELIHASIRDGIQMSTAKSYKFRHNDLEDVEKKLQSLSAEAIDNQEIYVVTESVFSMDGDTPDLKGLSTVCINNNSHLIIDEAHATGVFGNQGCGLVQELGIEDQIFARINTFGKGLGCHGAVVLGSENLKNYLINFARSFIYTTGLPPHSLATIQSAYQEIQNTSEIKILQNNITCFNNQLKALQLSSSFINSNSAIHCCIIPDHKLIKEVAIKLQKKGFEVKPILSPTVPKGKERLRFCLHSYNTKEEITEVLNWLVTFV